MLLLVFKQAALEGKVQLFLLPFALFLTAGLVVKQVEACLGARRLIYRLEKFGWSNKALQPTDPASGGAGG